MTPKTILRGGYGLFYGASTVLSESRLGFSVLTPWVVSNDGSLTPANTLSNPFPTGLLNATGASLGLNTLVGQGISFIDPNRQQPFTHQYSLTLQRELPGGVLLDVAYSGSLGRDLAVNQAVNAIPLQFIKQARDTFVATGRNILNDSVQNPFFGLIAAGPLSARTVTRGQLLRPYPHFTGITQLNRSIGRTRYDAFQMKASRRFANGFSLLVSYTNAKQLAQVRFLNDVDTALTKELSENDLPQRLVVSSSYELPFGKGKRFFGGAAGIGGKIVEGWQLNAIYQAQSGYPGGTWLSEGVLTTWPRELMRGVVLTRKLMLPAGTPRLTVEVAADPGRAWELSLYVNNRQIEKRLIVGGEKREWQTIETDLTPFAGQAVTLRLYQNLLIGNPARPPSAAQWKSITLK